jgi:hypothetical protein
MGGRLVVSDVVAAATSGPREAAGANILVPVACVLLMVCGVIGMLKWWRPAWNGEWAEGLLRFWGRFGKGGIHFGRAATPYGFIPQFFMGALVLAFYVSEQVNGDASDRAYSVMIAISIPWAITALPFLSLMLFGRPKFLTPPYTRQDDFNGLIGSVFVFAWRKLFRPLALRSRVYDNDVPGKGRHARRRAAR